MDARAAVLDRPFGTFRVESFPVPKPGPGEFLLRTELSGTCATDTHIYPIGTILPEYNAWYTTTKLDQFTSYCGYLVARCG